jgi:hypothetical protein
VIVKLVNNFWITGDVLFFMHAGRTEEVFRFTNSAGDATVFARAVAENVRGFVEHQVRNMPSATGSWAAGLSFKVEPSDNPSGLWVVHGTQEVDVESEK